MTNAESSDTSKMPGKKCPDFLCVLAAVLRDLCVQRLLNREGDEEKIKAANFVIDNSGSLNATEEQVRRVFQALRPQGI